MRQPPAEGHDLAVGTDAERRRPEAPLGGDLRCTREASLPAVAISGDTKSRDRPKRGARHDQPEPSGAAPEALGSGNESELCGPRAAPPGCGPRLYRAGVDTALAASGRTPCAGTWAAGVGRRPPGRGTCTPARPSHVGRPSDAHASGPPNDGTRGPRGAAAASGENAVRGGQALWEPWAAAESGRYAEHLHHGEHAAKTPPGEPEQRVRTPHGQRGLTCLPAPSPSSGTR